MACFDVSLRVEIAAETHQEAALIFQRSLSDYQHCAPLTFEVVGYEDDDALERTVEDVTLPAIPETEA